MRNFPGISLALYSVTHHLNSRYGSRESILRTVLFDTLIQVAMQGYTLIYFRLQRNYRHRLGFDFAGYLNTEAKIRVRALHNKRDATEYKKVELRNIVTGKISTRYK